MCSDPAVRALEIRRHSHRKTSGGSQLSQEGVDLARRVGGGIGPFAIVATSVVPRARETAVAMGFAVDHEVVTLSADAELYKEAESSQWWRDPQPFARLAAAIAEGAAYASYANSMAALWRDLVTPLVDGEHALFVGHSGELEAALVACFPAAPHAEWGPAFGPCEGARLSFEGDPAFFSAVELLRL